MTTASIPPPTPGTRLVERIIGIQYLRGIAASAVVGFHLSEVANHRMEFLGGLGVPMFFVISGFVMIMITGERTRPSTFALRRLVRIGPLYWLMTVAAVFLIPWSRHGLRNGIASMAFIPWPYPGAEMHLFPPLAVGWTLNLEMMFYTIFAALLFAPARLRVALLSAILIAMVSLGQSGLPLTATVRLWCYPIVLLFAYGAWIGVAWRRQSLSGRLRTVLVVVAGVLMAASLVMAEARDHLLALVTSWLSLVLVPIALALERRGWLPTRIAPLLLIGDASYAIYLTHPFVLAATQSRIGSRGLSPSATIAVFALCLFAGIVVHLLVERPLLRWGRRLLEVHRPVALVAW